MKKITLLIMAAGIGSRFGGGIKQLEPVGLHNEIIMDYSIHDAIEAGFNKIIFVIRKDIEADFRERIGNRVERTCEKLGIDIIYAFQSLTSVPEGFSVPEGRTKPWGTGQAVLAAKDLIHEPFAVINADDYYGKEAFRQLHDWLVQDHADNAIAMAGFILKNTLSENGGVTRGVCKVADGHTHISDVVETSNIIRTENGATADGVDIDPESYVSMNFWGFPGQAGCVPAYMNVLEQGFVDFFKNIVPSNPLKAEYLLPTHLYSPWSELLDDAHTQYDTSNAKHNFIFVKSIFYGISDMLDMLLWGYPRIAVILLGAIALSVKDVIKEKLLNFIFISPTRIILMQKRCVLSMLLRTQCFLYKTPARSEGFCCRLCCLWHFYFFSSLFVFSVYICISQSV